MLEKTVGWGGIWGKLENPALSKEHQPGTALWPSVANPFNFPRKIRNLEFYEKSLIYYHILISVDLVTPPCPPYLPGLNLRVGEQWVDHPTLVT